MRLRLLGIISFILSISLCVEANSKILNINDVAKSATVHNKQLMVFFHMSYCGYCKRMKNRTLMNPQVKNYIDKNFVLIDINIDDNEKVIFENVSYSKKDFANELDIDLFPTVIFFDQNAEVTYTARGHRKIKRFQKILEFIHTKSFEKVDFFDYYKEK